MKTIKLAILGLHNHYHAFPMGDYLYRGVPGAELVAVSDERPPYAQQFAEQYDVASHYTDYREMLTKEDLDGVIITSYTTAHAEHVEACAQAGLHVLLDKPLAASMEDGRKIVASVEKHGIKLMMAYILRYLPPYQKAKELIDQGVIGKPVSAIYSIRAPLGFIKDAPDATEQGWYTDPERGGYGGYFDHAVHFTDFLRWIFESEVTSVFGRVGNLTYKDIPVDDYGISIMTMESGAICTVESSWHAAEWYGPESSPDRCSLTGTEGEIEFHYQKSPQIEIVGNTPPYSDGRVHLDWKGEERYDICYYNLLEEFVRCIQEDREPVPNAVDGLKAIEIAIAGYQSNDSNRAINLPLT